MSVAFRALRYHQTEMKDTSAFTTTRHRKKRLRNSSGNSASSQVSTDLELDSFPLSKDGTKTKCLETVDLISDSDSSLIIVRKSRKSKKHKHGISHLEDVHIIHDEHSRKRHRHRCHHHSRHRHSHSSRGKGGRVHKRTCTKHRMSPEAVKIKEEPSDEDGDRTRQSHSSQSRFERRQTRSEDDSGDQTVRHERHKETLPANNIRNREQRESTYPRREGHCNRSEHTVSNDRQTGRSKELESRGSRNGRHGVSKGRRNRWGNEEENAMSTSHPIKQEPNSEGEEEYEWGRKSGLPKEEKNIPPGQRDKPNFGLSGKLAEDTNTFNGVLIKYSEPPEARKPKRRWRFYPFKGDKGLPPLYIHRQSSYLIGRDRKVADIPVDHPSCSKQHAALQYRLVPFEREDGIRGKRVRPYIIDLESSNGTFVNNVKIVPRTYTELLEKDVIKFGYSSREYVLLHEQSKDEELDDDVAAGGTD